MRLWVSSDLHLELSRGWDLSSADMRPDFDVLVVARDLISHTERGVNGCATACRTSPSSMCQATTRLTALISTAPWRTRRESPTGDFRDPKIIRTFGDVPDDLSAL
jgi:hypothetical protein